MALELESFETKTNPLDCVEDILSSNNWVFNRVNESELMVRVSGKHCDYRLFFIWQEEMNALQFCCQYDMVVSNHNTGGVAQALMNINENLWMGHFDIPKDTMIPTFRQTCLLRGLDDTADSAHIEDLVDVSMVQCERYFSAFHVLCSQQPANDQAMSLALMDTSGEA